MATTTKKATSIVGLKELRANMETYISRVDAGETITVCRRSKPLFNLTPIDEWGESGWNDVIDFRDSKGRGIDAAELLQAMKSYGQAD